MMKRSVLLLCLAGATAFAQYKLEPAGPPPPGVPANALQQDGVKISGPSGEWCDVWFIAKAPAAANNGEQNVSFTDIAQGTLLGVIRFPNAAKDRRGQAIKPGVYTMRLSFYPPDGAHQGVAPSRDFVLLAPIADDTDAAATPDFQKLVAMSKKVSGTPHPAVLNVWKPDNAGPATLKQEGDDWVLYSTMGDKPVALIVVGTYSG